MILGVSYSVFDGIELLESSIKQIRQHVDFIDVQYQLKSWFGKPIKLKDMQTLLDLQNRGLIDSLSLFNNFYELKPINLHIMQSKVFETTKRNSGLDKCSKKGCTHFMNIDVDEFYDSSQFKRAKELIVENNLETTAVHYLNYITPTLHRGFAPHLVPFIHKITPAARHTKFQPFFPGVDPTRGIGDESYKRWRIFDKEDIIMHHMEMIREDLSTKYEATSRFYLDRARIPELVSIVEKAANQETSINFKGIIYPGAKEDLVLTKVENKFGINI